MKLQIPNLTLTTDIIVGFPGETEEDFIDTINFSKEIGFTKIHVFPYSRRKGTVADTMPNQIDEQVKKRLSHDNDTFSDAFVSLSEVVTKGELLHLFSDSRKESSDEAISEILSFYGIKKDFNVPESITDPDEYLDYILNPVGMMRRTVTLSGDWYKSAFGAYLAVLDNDKSVALIPTRDGYRCINPIASESFITNKKNANRIDPVALCFYSPLPEKKLGIKDIVRYIFEIKSWYICTFGIINLLCMLANIVIGFVNRTFFVKLLSAEYLGVNSLFTNILTILKNK